MRPMSWPLRYFREIERDDKALNKPLLNPGRTHGIFDFFWEETDFKLNPLSISGFYMQ